MAEQETGRCDFKQGPLPSCAPLAAAYVPVQQESTPRYEPCDALTRGTLFPGLDLPFLNVVNKTNPYAGTPLGELMALGFVVKELNLYLDTHPQDAEAFRYLKTVLSLYEEGKATYVTRYGPITLSDLGRFDRYTWLQPPWPWEYRERIGE